MASMHQWIVEVVQNYTLEGVFLLMLLESALIPIPSEITMTTAGFLASRGFVNIWVVIVVGALGNVVGSLLAFYLGYVKGDVWVNGFIKSFGKFLFLHSKDYTKSKRWFAKYGQIVAFTSRLLPVVRTFVSLPAGIYRTNIIVFTLLTFLGSLIWSGVLAFIGSYFGERWVYIEPFFQKVQGVVVLLLICVVFVGGFKLKRRYSQN